MPGTKRVFFAINLPLSLKHKIFETFSEKISPKDCKIVPMENLHVTMRFIGNVPDEIIAGFREKLGALRETKKFSAKAEGMGTFNGRVLWIGFSDGKKEIETIAEKLSESLELEKEKFECHITIARNGVLGKKQFNELAEKLNSEKFAETFKVESIELMQSEIDGKGSKYSEIFSVKFA